MAKVEQVIKLLKGMEGSIHVFKLDDATREKVVEIESQVKATLGISCLNLGVEKCLKRQNVIVVIKDSRFRPPPEPTVLLIADKGEVVLGREIFPHERKEFEDKPNVIFLSQDFIVYTDKMPKTKELFVMPPVSFPEVAELPGVINVVSCSPSPPADMYVRAAHGLPDDPKLASILIGYDNSKK
ncbi:MAG: hypothetical protein LUQ16_07505 [Methanomassiliicoccales archaeon]|nr:hypothetical protein [Methanomassiliicoccales archaeon]MDD1756764.1 hypothetical protein [Methanomassiliicoccales archaeon]